MPIDYSKWKTIEVSDDEDDTHPNIDTPSLFRWRHQARMERMAQKQQEKEEVEKGKKKALTRLEEIEQKLNDANLDDKEKVKLSLEKEEIKRQEDEYEKKEKELEEKERLEPWNVDTIGKEAWSKSVINKANEKKPLTEKVDEEEDNQRMMQYFRDNEDLMKEYGKVHGFEKSEEFLLEHSNLCSDYCASFLTIEALNLAMEQKYDEMDLMAAQCITLQYLLELAKSLHALPTNSTLIKTFFKKIKAADVAYMKMYEDEVGGFRDRLKKRAHDKIEAAMNEAESEAKAKRIAESPGGIDPQEVFDTLPEEMQDAFSSQNMQVLYEVAEKMDPEVFQYHLKRCIDSGLWVPNVRGDKEANSDVEADKTQPDGPESNSK
uniref:Hsp90 chaperone protein kinase-targeting subunit n=1 Tax=Acrobeloides nanus TaxID=290746 RepID=A0A914DXL4_9BILA